MQQHILIFKTNIATTTDRSKIAPVLDRQQHVVSWTVDMEDVDCVLRVVANEPVLEEITALISANGYACTELDD
jgi:hypothetical protein